MPKATSPVMCDRIRFFRLPLLAVILILTSFPHPLAAQTVIWDGGSATNDNWSDEDNWNAAVTTGSNLQFAGSVRPTPQNDLVNLAIGSITFNSGTAAFVVAGNSIGLNGNVTNSSSNLQTINLDMQLNNAIHTFNSGSAGLTTGGTLSGVGGLNKSGSGTLTLSGNNSYDGVTTVSQGLLTASHDNAFGSTAAGTTVSAGATIQLDGVTITGETLTLNGLGLGNNGALRTNAQNGEWAGNVILGSGVGSGTGSGTGARLGTMGSGNLTVSGNITDEGGGYDLVIRSANSVTGKVILSGENSYNDTHIVVGTVQLDEGNNRLPTGTLLHMGNGSGTVGTGATELDLNGWDQEVAGLVELGTAMSNVITNRNATTTSTLTINNATAVNYGVNNANSRINGNLNLIKQGNGLLTLGSANGYTGLTHIQGGQVTILHASALGSTAGGTRVDTGSTLRLEGSINVGAEALFISGNGTGSGGVLRNVAGNNTWAGQITLEAAAEIQTDNGTQLTINVASGAAITGEHNLTLDAQANSTLTIADPIDIGSANVIKNGLGTVVFSGTTANAYTGTTIINDGLLALAKSDGINAIIGNITLGNNAGGFDILRLDANNQIANSSILTLNGSGDNAGIFRLNGHSETLGGIQSGSSGAGIIENDGGGSSVLTVAIAVTSTSDVAQTYSGLLRDGDGAGDDGTLGLTVSRTGGGTGSAVLQLTSANTYSGATTVNSGAVLRISNDDALGAADGTTATGTVVNNGGRVELTGNITVEDEVLTLNGPGGNPSNIGGLRSVGSSGDINTWAGQIILGSGSGGGTGGTRVGATSGTTLNLTGQILGPNFDLGIRNDDFNSTVVFGGTHSGATASNWRNTYIVVGRVRLADADDRLPTGTVVTMGNASNVSSTELDLNGQNQTIAGLADDGSTMSNEVTNNDNANGSTLTINNTEDHSFGLTNGNSVITGNLALVKTGPGRQTLGSANTYTGSTTVGGGILEVGRGGTAASRDNGRTGEGIATNVLTVETGGMVVGTGTIAGTNDTTHYAHSGGIIAPGDIVDPDAVDPTGIGTLDVTGNLNAIGGAINLQIGGSSLNDSLLAALAPGTTAYNDYLSAPPSAWETTATGTARGDHDLLNITGGLSLDETSSVTVSLFDDYMPEAGDVFDLMDWVLAMGSVTLDVGENLRSGGLGGGQLDLAYLSSGLYWDVSQFASHGVLLVVAPEPGRALLLGLSLTCLLLRRRRRK